jgi:hypothetical protein
MPQSLRILRPKCLFWLRRESNLSGVELYSGHFVVVLGHPIVARTNDLIEMNFIALIPCYLYYFISLSLEPPVI